VLESPAMLALIGNLDWFELVIIFAGALMVFGKRLPEVAMRAAVQIGRLKRQVSEMWRQAGLEDELRKMRREIELDLPRPDLSLPRPADLSRKAKSKIDELLDPNFEPRVAEPDPVPEEVDPDAYRADPDTLQDRREPEVHDAPDEPDPAPEADESPDEPDDKEDREVG